MRRVHRWGLLVWTVLAVLAATAVAPHRGAAQSADNGLEEQSVNSFELDPSRGVVRVTIDISLRNVTTDRDDGNVVRRTYFDTYAVAVPRGAENIVATRGGEVLAGELISDPEFPAFSTYRFPLGTQLFSGQSATLQVTYDHFGAPPRDPVPWRVNEAYAGYVAFGLGDDGLVTVRISQPFGYEFDESTDLTGFETSAPDAFGTIVHTRSALDADDRIIVGMANDDRLVSRQLGVPDADIQLRAWPDDPDWVDFAAATVEAGIPALEDLLGSRWPIENRLDVRETVEPSLSGYAGWFDRESNEIAVGEDLDADTIYHELSHAWFNGAVSTERWFTEGLAQVYAAEVVRRDGGDPRQPAPPATDAPGALPLTDWASTVGESDRDVEAYGYDSSFWVVDVLVDEIGFDQTREVVNALRDGSSAYDPAATGERPDEDWQRVYDAVVEIGGAITAHDVFQARVVDPEGALLIDQRDRAAADVADLERRSAPWSLPIGVRNRLERWELDDVTEAVTSAEAVLERRAELEAIEVAVGIDEPDLAGAAYGDASMGASGGVDFGDTNRILGDQIALGEQLIDRRQRIAGRSETAQVTPPEVATLDGVDDFATALDAADAQLLAIEQVIDIEERIDSTSGLLARIGSWGSDIDGDVDRARAQLESGDTAAALDTLDSAEARIDDLDVTGALRLAIAGAVLGLLVIMLVLFRRRRRPHDDERQRGAPATTAA
jgi:hypothetical protein